MPTATDDESESEIAIDQPGLIELRDAVANRRWWPRLPGFTGLRRDGLAGLSGAVSNVPDGMANGVLVGVNPVYGLYATMMGPAVGGFLSSTQLMMITTTAAASLSTSQALGALQGNERAEGLFVLVMLAGIFQILFGFLRLGRLIRFVSYSVTTGLLSGVSVLLILNQLPVVTGYQPAGGNRIAQTLDLMLNLGQINLVSLMLAALTLALAVLLPRTPLSNFGRLVAIAVPSLLVALLGLTDIKIVQHVGDIPQGIPLPGLKPRDIRAVWNAGGPSRLAAGGTFLAALLLSIQAAVGIGVLLSALLYVSRASTDVSLVELVEGPDGRIEERERPKRLPSGKVTVLDVYGHLFYAGAHTLERLLPRSDGARTPAVVLRLRGFTTAGVTLQEVLANYADKLAEVDGQLYLTGISQPVHGEVVRTGKLRLSGPVQVYGATSIRWQSTWQAVEDARTWLVGASTEAEISDNQR